MKARKRVAVPLAAAMVALLLGGEACAEASVNKQPEERPAAFSVSSASFKSGARLPSAKHVYNKLDCGGDNVSPDVSWKNAPKGTKSYAVTLFDPDAKTGSGWWHWIVFNIPSSVTHLKEGASGGDTGDMPEGSVESRTDFGTPGYQGPCPPAGSGTHRYVLTVYALDVASLPLDHRAPGAKVGGAIQDHRLASATVKFTYGREKAD